MKCPHCQAENDSGARVCASCGASLPADQAGNGSLKAATNAGILIGAKARKARMVQVVDPSAIISTRAYNAVICGVLLWGLLVNYLLCRYAVGFAASMNPWVLLIGYVVLALAGTIIAAKSHNPAVSFLGYNMVVIPFGLVISLLVDHYTKIDPSIVTYAFLYTMLIAIGMMALVMIVPQFFAKLGGVLLGALCGVILCEAVLMIFGVRQHVTDWAVAGIFSLYIGYDIYRSQQFPKTLDNAVDSALDIYMDLANLFIRLLEIIGDSKN